MGKKKRYKKVEYEHYRVSALHAPHFKKRGKPLRVHLHRYFRSSSLNFFPHEKGGQTTCRLIGFGKKGILAVGIATCSMSDNFCYATGRNLAFERAEAKL